jgi:2-isopropylmalate synthase
LNALYKCMRACLAKEYPEVKAVRLTNYKVRVLDAHRGTAAKVRVSIEWSDGCRKWSTVGVSESVVEAGWSALLDAIRLELMRSISKDTSIAGASDAR